VANTSQKTEDRRIDLYKDEQHTHHIIFSSGKHVTKTSIGEKVANTLKKQKIGEMIFLKMSGTCIT